MKSKQLLFLGALAFGLVCISVPPPDAEAGTWKKTCSKSKPSKEICHDGIDNDCDGYIDNYDSDCKKFDCKDVDASPLVKKIESQLSTLKLLSIRMVTSCVSDRSSGYQKQKDIKDAYAYAVAHLKLLPKKVTLCTVGGDCKTVDHTGNLWAIKEAAQFIIKTANECVPTSAGKKKGYDDDSSSDDSSSDDSSSDDSSSDDSSSDDSSSGGGSGGYCGRLQQQLSTVYATLMKVLETYPGQTWCCE